MKKLSILILLTVLTGFALAQEKDLWPRWDKGKGAKFIFSRQVDGQPFLTDTGDVRFFAQLNSKITLSTKYKLHDMMYEGKLEY